MNETGPKWAAKGGIFLTNKQYKALAALLTQPTKEKAAAAAGIGISTLKRYLAEEEFQTAYNEAVSKLIDDAASQAKKSLSPALSCLQEVVADGKETATARIQAARALLEFGLRLIETADISKRLDSLEDVVEERGQRA